MRKGLGRGLAQLVGEQLEDGAREIGTDQIVPNARQPRRVFAEEALTELADSIRVHGVLSPLLVRPVGDERYELIAGERRLRASRMAGLETVPVRIMAVRGQESLEIALIENVQRADISAAESAYAYRQLIDEFGLTQEEVAARVGKSRPAVANTLRLLKLNDAMLASLQIGEITEGHARALLGIADEGYREKVFRLAVKDGLSVREVERLATATKPPRRPREEKDVFTKHLETSLGERFAAPVAIERGEKGGRISIAFFSDEDFERVLEALGLKL